MTQSDTPTITAEQIAAYREEQARRCLARIQAVLREESCELLAVPQLVADGVGGWRLVADVKILPK